MVFRLMATQEILHQHLLSRTLKVLVLCEDML